MRDMERFLEWLLAFNFDGGGHDDAAIAEGLADALVMFPKPPNGDQTQQYLLGERHCILVAASNPYPFPTPVLVPKIKDDQFCGAEADCCVADAKTVAGMFTQCSVSLSVISPKKFPKLEQLYNAVQMILEVALRTIYIALY
ncbi:Mediator of RNA polymerase II transcription subunit 25 [Morella rubra]|uniref:Mediator of RNA polymerase II transcription subunit 25 n=1 Tax=Morella rubra TaxID=262757 RepID=A0A6A1VIE3_9ROSI|nr:Mediator of RNA polymerase II transcription subunit 25 [Morella rubra]